jgi:hypothetical protein
MRSVEPIMQIAIRGAMRTPPADALGRSSVARRVIVQRARFARMYFMTPPT